jgi:hypothetical protein
MQTLKQQSIKIVFFWEFKSVDMGGALLVSVAGWLEFQDPFGWQLHMAGCLLVIFCLPELCQAQCMQHQSSQGSALASNGL